MLNNHSELSATPETDTQSTPESTAEPAASTVQSSQELPEIVYEIEGEEIPLDTIKKWKSGHLMQADYTKKTQEHSEKVKQFSVKELELNEKLSALSDIEGEIQKLALGDLNEVNLDELLDVDPAEYLKTQKKIEQRKHAVAGLIEKRNKLQSENVQKSVEFLHQTLGWQDAAKRESDISAISNYAKEKGYSDQEFNRITDPKVMIAFLDAANYQKLLAEAKDAKKKVLQAPKSSKPTSSVPSRPLTLAERLYGRD